MPDPWNWKAPGGWAFWAWKLGLFMSAERAAGGRCLAGLLCWVEFRPDVAVELSLSLDATAWERADSVTTQPFRSSLHKASRMLHNLRRNPGGMLSKTTQLSHSKVHVNQPFISKLGWRDLRNNKRESVSVAASPEVGWLLPGGSGVPAIAGCTQMFLHFCHLGFFALWKRFPLTALPILKGKLPCQSCHSLASTQIVLTQKRTI